MDLVGVEVHSQGPAEEGLEPRTKMPIGHVFILADVVTLMVGTWAASSAHQSYRRLELPFLRSLFLYIIVFNVSVFLSLVSKYLWVNLLSHDASTGDPALERLLFLVVLAVASLVAFALVRVALQLRGSPSLGAADRWFLLAAALFTVSLGFGSTRQAPSGWLLMTGRVLILASLTVIVSTLVLLATREPTNGGLDLRRPARVFAQLMLSGYLPLGASSLLPAPYRALASSAALLWLNLVPLIWIRGSLLPHLRPLSATVESARLERLVREHRISRREREIMGLILEGKSNKEIEERLSISFNTVKNHVYNLYQKLGVKSRGQLMYLVMKSSRLDPAPRD